MKASYVRVAIVSVVFVDSLASGCARPDPVGGRSVRDQPDPPEQQSGALPLGGRLELVRLALARGGELVFADVLAAGPAVIVWVGGAEHAYLGDWVQRLDAGLPRFEDRGATLIMVRPLPAERLDAFADELDLQVVVAGDETGALGHAAGFAEPVPDWAVLVIAPDFTVRYRKFAGRLPERLPELAELLGVIDGLG